VVTGWYDDLVSNTAFYFIPNGKVTALEEGEANSISDFGVIAGVQPESTPSLPLLPFANQGFLSIGQKTVTFQVTGAIDGGTTAAYVNDFGVVAGTYAAQQAPDHAVVAGFLRTQDGKFTVFAAPTGSLMNLQVDAVNIFATTTGWFEEPSVLDHTFARYADGTLLIPSMPVGEVESIGTAVNARGVVVGWWEDSSAVFHGYTWIKDSKVE
jgi:hypothetical protein